MYAREGLDIGHRRTRFSSTFLLKRLVEREFWRTFAAANEERRPELLGAVSYSLSPCAGRRSLKDWLIRQSSTGDKTSQTVISDPTKEGSLFIDVRLFTTDNVPGDFRDGNILQWRV